MLFAVFCYIRDRLDIAFSGVIWVEIVKRTVGSNHDVLYIFVLPQIFSDEDEAGWIRLAVEHVIHPQFLQQIERFFYHGGMCFWSTFASFPRINGTSIDAQPISHTDHIRFTVILLAEVEVLGDTVFDLSGIRDIDRRKGEGDAGEAKVAGVVAWFCMFFAEVGKVWAVTVSLLLDDVGYVVGLVFVVMVVWHYESSPLAVLRYCQW